MAPKQLEDGLQTDESQSVGHKSRQGAESTGHASGRRIAQLLRTEADLGEDDLADMTKVVSYVHRHLAQAPTREDAGHSRWRYSLMNWGHDPLPG